MHYSVAYLELNMKHYIVSTTLKKPMDEHSSVVFSLPYIS